MVIHPRAVVLLNPGSSRAEQIVADPDRIMKAFGGAIDVRLAAVGENEDLVAITRAAIADGASIVVAGGGDGTVSAVASAVVGTPVALGILPLGTANSVAEALGLPMDLESACQVIVSGERRAIDTARVGETFMVLMATIGLNARAVTEATAEAKERLGVIAYVGKALEVLLDQDPFEVQLELPGQPIVRATANAVTVANLVPARSVLAQGPPAVVPDDGVLDITLVAFSDALDAIATSVHLFTHALRGLPADRAGVGFTRSHRVTITANPAQTLMVDGEAVGTTPFTVECVPTSLNVIVPVSAPT